MTGTKTYYPAGGAMRVDGTRYYVLKDHLGSASVVTNQSATTVGEDRFYPFGETRFTTGTMYTDKLFTGQREVTGLGIYHFGARFYSPKLGRFLSADTIVPGYANPQNLNRYSYVLNNPLRYIDPTGHNPCRSDYLCKRRAERMAATQAANATDKTAHSGMVAQPATQTGGGWVDNYCNTHPGACGASVSKPNPSMSPSTGGGTCGTEGYYSSHCPGWHFYRTTNEVCPVHLHCTEAEMQDYLHRFAYPSQNPSNPVRNGDVNLVWIGIIPLGYIRTRVDGLTIINVAQHNHLMYDGQVERQAIQDSDGSWYIVTTGMGNNVQIPIVPAGPSGSAYQQMQYIDLSAANQDLGPGAFNDLDQAMLNYIAEHQ